MTLKIDKKSLASLSVLERGILEKLGLVPEEKPKTLKAKKPPKTMKTFTFATYISCSLCQSETVLFWKMSPRVDPTSHCCYWQGKKISFPKPILEDRREERRQQCCHNCQKELLKLSKEELVKKVIFLARQVSRQKERSPL